VLACFALKKKNKMSDLIFPEECYAIQGAVFAVYKEIGCGFLEAVYQECLERELTFRHIPFESHKLLRLYYKGELIEKTYQADFLCYEKIIVEIKAVETIAPIHQAQLLNYLKMSKLTLGLLVNFGAFPKAKVVRVANTQEFQRETR
jgi:GxxExxY protein